ncbi:hypothetical protein SLE2022_127140 [Rubroshorea leprosula]
MMVFCKKSVNSFLGIPGVPSEPIKSQSSKCGLRLITSDAHRLPNVIESSVLKPAALSPPLPPLAVPEKKDPGGIGFIDEVGGGVDGLMSCTESLGFESSDERRFDDGMGFCESKAASTSGASTARRTKSGSERWRERKKKFPPPLSSLNQNGQPSFYLRPVRKDGRLELTEIRIDRPETLRAHREGGRLTLQLVRNDHYFLPIDEEQELEENKELKFQLQEENEEIEGTEDNGIGENWGFRVTGEGLRRCHELLMSQHNHHHHPNNLHVWRQHCVPTS